MAARSRRRMALVAVAALCMGVPACGRSVSTTQGSGSGIVSPTIAGVVRTVTVSVVDQFGNVASGYTGTVHFTSTDPSATLPPDHQFTAGDAGDVFFDASQGHGVTYVTPGNREVQASDNATDEPHEWPITETFCKPSASHSPATSSVWSAMR